MKKKTDAVEVTDKSGRRRFVRSGAALLLAGSSFARAQEGEGIRTDCDSQGHAGEKNAEIAGNDSDTGATADRPGCGVKKPPAMTKYNKKPADSVVTKVSRVKV